MEYEKLIKAVECCGGKGCKTCPYHCESAECLGILMRDLYEFMTAERKKKYTESENDS